MSRGNIKLKTCSVCKKVFAGPPGQNMCWDCQKKVHDMEDKVLAYVREHPNTHVQEIHKETGASLKLIQSLMKKGVFEMSGAAVAYPCKSCGKPIFHGTYCAECLQRLQHDLKRAKKELDREAASEQKKTSSGYFYSFDEKSAVRKEAADIQRRKYGSGTKPLVEPKSYLGRKIYHDRFDPDDKK